MTFLDCIKKSLKRKAGYTLALLVYSSSLFSTTLSVRPAFTEEECKRPLPRAANHNAQPILSSSTVFRGDTRWLIWRDL